MLENGYNKIADSYVLLIYYVYSFYIIPEARGKGGADPSAWPVPSHRPEAHGEWA